MASRLSCRGAMRWRPTACCATIGGGAAFKNLVFTAAAGVLRYRRIGIELAAAAAQLAELESEAGT
jgi:hypothetical protein